jgi:1-acyl-sn-glycerol-3-phosphate acyltransferase
MPMELVYRALELGAFAAAKAAGITITYQGVENLPARGGAVVAANHTSYVDFLPVGLAGRRRGRWIRLMPKAEMQKVAIVNFVIKHTGAIPVDRQAGAAAYAEAVRALQSGELVGVYPEATISRSFELKEFKSGTARMALEAQVPIIPMIVWGSQRIWTKGHPKNLGRNKIPIVVQIGRPLLPTGSAIELDAALRAAMTALLHDVQERYPHPAGAYWVPRRLGGGAPTPTEATLLDEAESLQRARRTAQEP